jgi:hypothetical protein
VLDGFQQHAPDRLENCRHFAAAGNWSMAGDYDCRLERFDARERFEPRLPIRWRSRIQVREVLRNQNRR